MKLKKFHVRLYRNIVDSCPIEIEDLITCLIGKNESGKTALLHALCSLNPAHPNIVRVDVTMDYPRWRKVRDERETDLSNVVPIEASFDLHSSDLEALQPYFPFQLPDSLQLTAQKSYGGALVVTLTSPEEELVATLLKSELLDDQFRSSISHITALEALSAQVTDEIQKDNRRTRRTKDLVEFQSLLQKAKAMQSGEFTPEAKKVLVGLVPKFFYFSQYSSLPGRVDLTNLLQKSANQLSEEEQTSISLLRLVGVQGKEFMEANFEIRISELEAAANEVTRQIFDYWTQNTDLIVSLQGDSETVQTPQGQSVVHRYLDIRLNDLRHQMTTNFETRSSGFQWFFSFIIAFSEFERSKNVIVLLDEPALGLHARAQADLLRFIEQRLGSVCQVLYTTHSPFLVNPKHLDRARLVEDLTSRSSPDLGAKVTTDVLSVRGDTLFPLQAALGYDLAQNLFVGRYNLVVEGVSDLVFLTVLSEHLASLDRTCLDSRYTIAPVGGADKIPTFVALLGAHLDLTVLVDAKASRSQRLLDMVNKGLLQGHRLVSVGQISSIPSANIEDFFEPKEYLELYNGAFGSALDLTDLIGADSIVDRIERRLSAEYDHLRPAMALLKNPDAFLQKITPETLTRFEELFRLLNNTLTP